MSDKMTKIYSRRCNLKDSSLDIIYLVRIKTITKSATKPRSRSIIIPNSVSIRAMLICQLAKNANGHCVSLWLSPL